MKYPNGKNEKNYNFINYGNRGMALEDDINKSNEYYRVIDRAIIYKKPTPIQVTKVSYNTQGSGKIIKKAYFKTPSTTDYNGLYKGKYIDFEVKETKNKKHFPLSNIHPHQIEHIKNIIKHGGITFLIVGFSSVDKTYLIRGEDFISYINNKKSVPITFFEEYGYEVQRNFNPRLEYLNIIDQIYFGGDISEKNK